MSGRIIAFMMIVATNLATIIDVFAQGRLEVERSESYNIGKETLLVEKPIYARIKKLSDGNYFLMWQKNRIASTVYYSLSSDLKTWSPGKVLFSPSQINTVIGEDTRAYSSADAVVMSNGDLIVAASARAVKTYKVDSGYDWIVMRRSRDNGKTWEEEKKIYNGCTWEPFLYETPDGILHCYFTDATILHTNNKKGTSGTSVVYSKDMGETWESHGYRDRTRVCRQYKYTNSGIGVYTDQMPSFCLLDDGKTMFGFLESRLEENETSSKSVFKMSLVYGEYPWKGLDYDEAGPEDRISNICSGAAGYVGKFPCGEVLISCNIATRFSMKTGTRDARTFSGKTFGPEGWFQPFLEKGYWGSFEILSDDEVLAVIHSEETPARIQFAKIFVNREQTPRKAYSDSLYLGSEFNDASATIKMAYDKGMLKIKAFRKDKDIRPGDDLILKLASDHNFRQIVYCAQTGRIKKPKGVTASITKGEDGYCLEVSLKAKGRLYFKADLLQDGIVDTFTDAADNDSTTWIPVNLH